MVKKYQKKIYHTNDYHLKCYVLLLWLKECITLKHYWKNLNVKQKKDKKNKKKNFINDYFDSSSPDNESDKDESND